MLYLVLETHTKDNDVTACGVYTTLDKAKDAIIDRVRDGYSDEEVAGVRENFAHSWHVIAPANLLVDEYKYEIFDLEPDGPMV